MEALGPPMHMSLLDPLQTPVPLSNTFSHLHPKGISEVTCPGPSLNPTPPDGSSSQGTPVSGQGRGGPSPPPETPLERATPLSAPLLHDELPPAPSMVFKAPRGWARPFCSLFSRSSLPAPTGSSPGWTSSWSLLHLCLCSSLSPECPLLSNKLLLILQGPAERSHS